MHLACGLWDMFYTISTIDVPCHAPKRTTLRSNANKKTCRMSLRKTPDWKVTLTDGEPIQFNPIYQFAKTTNRLVYLTDVQCTRPGGPFFHSLSINFSRPRVTSPPPRLKTSRQSFHTPPSRTHTFLPAMRIVALVCVFNWSHRLALAVNRSSPSWDSAQGWMTVVKSPTLVLSAQCSAWEREFPIWEGLRFRQEMNGRIRWEWCFWKLHD